MKKITLLLTPLLTTLVVSLIFSFPAFSETYVCAFKCFGKTDKICQSEYTRAADGFKGDYGSEFLVKENERYISMSNPYAGIDGAAVFSVIIDKLDLNYTKSTTELEYTVSRLGTCSKID
jgi:hypothetical protein